ncbi:hypothetical protein R6242_21575 [Iodobacter sp. CM08]|nr:hypothetical protein [Iodobacter sp. CM08]MDW5419168.1 hypothetical protein [Iodobacter sp. CM08]
MTHSEAQQIINDSEAEIVLDEEKGLARLNGEFTIEELHAILPRLEYNA